MSTRPLHSGTALGLIARIARRNSIHFNFQNFFVQRIRDRVYINGSGPGKLYWNYEKIVRI